MESISKLSGILETARDLTLEAASDASRARKPYTTTLPIAQLKKLLDSRNEREVLEGLRRVIAMSCRNPATAQSSILFSHVLKNVASPSLPIKKLVYIYLLQHAESEPDTALLAINTVQKTLSSPDPHLRALALRVMSGIRVPVISQIVSLGIKKGIADMSPLVRKAAALAIPKCWRLDPGTAPQLLEYLSTLLGDRQYYVVSAAVIAFLETCPERIDMIHPHYRSLVRKLVDMDEWGQLATLRLLTRYARLCFPQRFRRVQSGGDLHAQTPPTKGFYDEESSEDTEDEQTSSDADSDNTSSDTLRVAVLDPDLDLFLKAAQPLLSSRNAAVIVGVARAYLALSPATHLDLAVGPLVSLLRSPADIQSLALPSIVQVALVRPEPFVRHATRFLVRASDPARTWRLKLELLAIVFPHSPAQQQALILAELAHFARTSADAELVRESVHTLGRCAQAGGRTAPSQQRCLALLLAHIDPSSSQSSNGNSASSTLPTTPHTDVLVAESLTILRHLIQADPAAHATTITRLAKNLDNTPNPRARASIIWLVGEYCSGQHVNVNGTGNIAADVLRILLKGFANEAEQVKAQIVLLAAKVYLGYLNRIKEDLETGAQHAADQSTSDYAEENGNGDSNANGNQLGDISGSETSSSTAFHPIAKLWHHTLTLTRYDTSYDLRDRARLYRSLLPDPLAGLPTLAAATSENPSFDASSSAQIPAAIIAGAAAAASTQLATLLLLAPKPVPLIPSPSAPRRGFTLGSASLIVGEEAGPVGIRDYEPLPDWVKAGKEPNANLRREYSASDVDATSVTSAYGRGKNVVASETLPDGGWPGPKPADQKKKEVSLDAWLDGDEEEDDEDEEDSEDEEEDSEDESEEESDESDADDEHGRLVN